MSNKFVFFEVPFNHKDNFKAVMGSANCIWLTKGMWCISKEAYEANGKKRMFLIPEDKYQAEVIDIETAKAYAEFYLDNRNAIARVEKQTQIDAAKDFITLLPKTHNENKITWRVMYPRYSQEPIIKGTMKPHNVEFVLHLSQFDLDKFLEELDWLHERKETAIQAQKEMDDFAMAIIEGLPEVVDNYYVTYKLEHYKDFRRATNNTQLCYIVAQVPDLHIEDCNTYIFYTEDRYYDDLLEGKSPLDLLRKHIAMVRSTTKGR